MARRGDQQRILARLSLSGETYAHTAGKSPVRVAMFITCCKDTAFPERGKAIGMEVRLTPRRAPAPRCPDAGVDP